jgi:hypothetical protein
VAVNLLNKVKAKIAELDHWTDKQETKAEVDTLIGKSFGKSCRKAIPITQFLHIGRRFMSMCI